MSNIKKILRTHPERGLHGVNGITRKLKDIYRKDATDAKKNSDKASVTHSAR